MRTKQAVRKERFIVGRLLRFLVLVLLLTLPLVASLSRGASQQGQVPVVEQTQPVNPVQPTTTLAPTATTFDPERTPEPTPFPTATPVITADVRLLVDVRHDLELLATAALQTFPPGWNNNVDQTNPQIALLTRSDLELLAATLINPESRPDGWIGAVGSTPIAIARDARHDLELLAEILGYVPRPEGWRGSDPLHSCSRATQTLIRLLERGGIYRLQLDANDPDFCYKAEIEVTRFTEMEILGNAEIGELFSSDVAILSPHNISSDVAVAFLDTSATRRVGVLPPGTPIRPIARSRVEFSRMMLVAGDGFQVFVEHTNTTVTRQQYRNLPNVNALEFETFCNAEWCEAN